MLELYLTKNKTESQAFRERNSYTAEQTRFISFIRCFSRDFSFAVFKKWAFSLWNNFCIVILNRHVCRVKNLTVPFWRQITPVRLTVWLQTRAVRSLAGRVCPLGMTSFIKVDEGGDLLHQKGFLYIMPNNPVIFLDCVPLRDMVK